MSGAAEFWLGIMFLAMVVAGGLMLWETFTRRRR